MKKFISPISCFKPIEFEVFKNHFVVSKTRKVRKGNYVKVNDKYMAPFNEQEQRIAMRNNSSINVYWILSPKMKKPYIKFGSNKCYLKEIDILTDWFDVNELDPATLYDEQYEIIFNLRDKLFFARRD